MTKTKINGAFIKNGGKNIVAHNPKGNNQHTIKEPIEEKEESMNDIIIQARTIYKEKRELSSQKRSIAQRIKILSDKLDILTKKIIGVE